MFASARTLMARPRSWSGTRSCIAVFEEASDQTQKTPPTASARPDSAKLLELAYSIAQTAKPSIDSGIKWCRG